MNGIEIFILIGVLAYFVPTGFAWMRGHPSKLGITALNVLLGWSVLGWIGSLVWSLSGKGRAA